MDAKRLLAYIRESETINSLTSYEAWRDELKSYIEDEIGITRRNEIKAIGNCYSRYTDALPAINRLLRGYLVTEYGTYGAGKKIFIGHGGSRLWKDLKDFLQDRMHLPWDEFNRVPVGGITNINRLMQMLDEAAIAFLVMTAEDEQADGKHHARQNVIHEAGLFQGRLGFERAILLLEEGCEEFSNVQGLGQIRFPRGKIASIFEDIRLILEREGLINAH